LNRFARDGWKFRIVDAGNSGSKKRHAYWQVWLRRLSQTGFTLLFLALFLDTLYHPVNRAGRYGKLFFELDPLVLLSSWIAGHEIASGLLLSLIVVGVTFLAGRWFCGWVCPFGALHNLVTSLRGKRAKDKIARGGYSNWQKVKYHVLVVFLGSALLGLNLAGWLDPFSLFFRSLTVVVMPMFHDGATAIATWIYQQDPHLGALHATAVTEPLYESLRRNVLASAQPHYYGAIAIAVVFFAAVLLNLFRARFWCRYVCPLGALLGFLGKNPLLRLKRNPEACNNCGLCVAECQGGAGPDALGGWKPAECFYCWNCRSACPKRALSFTCRVPGRADL
jgi:polyferredoxin